MAKVDVMVALMVIMVLVVEGRDWRLSVKRIKRGYNNGFGTDVTYERPSDEQNASVSREGLNVCSGEGDRGGSREQLAYNTDGRSNENGRGNRSFTKSSASASASSFSQNHNLA